MQTNPGTAKGGPFAVTRTVRTADVPPERLDRVARGIEGTEGILQASVGRRGRLRVRYDASCVGFWDVERMLDEAGVALSRGVGWRLKSAWYRFLDQNARANAVSKGGACCSNPVDVFAKRRRG